MAVENNKEIDLHCGDGWRWDRCGRVRRPMCFRAYWNNSGKQRESSWGERTSMKEEGKSFGERRKRTLAFGMPYKISNCKLIANLHTRCGDEGRHDGDGESKLPSDETDSDTWWADAEKKESSVKYVFYGEFLEQNPVGESWPIHEEGYESQKTLIR